MNRQRHRAPEARPRVDVLWNPNFRGRPADGDLFEYAKNFAVEGFAAGHGSFQPAAFIVDTEQGRRVVIAATIPEREYRPALHASLRKAFRDLGAVAYARISEVWVAPPEGRGRRNIHSALRR